jgi:CubicO group peptidase (beta-lactamase class C family)
MAQRRVFVEKALVVAVMGRVGTILAAGQHKEQSTASTVAAKKDGRAEIDRYAAEWLKESDVPSVAVAYIEHRQVAWQRSWRHGFRRGEPRASIRCTHYAMSKQLK